MLLDLRRPRSKSKCAGSTDNLSRGNLTCVEPCGATPTGNRSAQDCMCHERQFSQNGLLRLERGDPFFEGKESPSNLVRDDKN
jgi:hypothetical protein